MLSVSLSPLINTVATRPPNVKYLLYYAAVKKGGERVRDSHGLGWAGTDGVADCACKSDSIRPSRSCIAPNKSSLVFFLLLNPVVDGGEVLVIANDVTTEPVSAESADSTLTELCVDVQHLTEHMFN